MAKLTSLIFTQLPKLAAADPVVARRNKLILRLQQQKSLGKAGEKICEMEYEQNHNSGKKLVEVSRAQQPLTISR